MGGFSASVQQPQASQPTSGKGGPTQMQMDGGFASGVDTPEMYTLQKPNQMSQPMPEMTAQPAVMPQGGKGQQSNYSPSDGTMGGKGASTNSATSGQPRMGQPNRYANTIPQWDNASQQLGPAQSSGKGKGG